MNVHSTKIPPRGRAHGFYVTRTKDGEVRYTRKFRTAWLATREADAWRSCGWSCELVEV